MPSITWKKVKVEPEFGLLVLESNIVQKHRKGLGSNVRKPLPFKWGHRSVPQILSLVRPSRICLNILSYYRVAGSFVFGIGWKRSVRIAPLVSQVRGESLDLNLSISYKDLQFINHFLVPKFQVVKDKYKHFIRLLSDQYSNIVLCHLKFDHFCVVFSLSPQPFSIPLLCGWVKSYKFAYIFLVQFNHILFVALGSFHYS